jgi:hypothetical protein
MSRCPRPPECSDNTETLALERIKALLLGDDGAGEGQGGPLETWQGQGTWHTHLLEYSTPNAIYVL